MKKYILGGAVVLAVFLYAIRGRFKGNDDVNVIPPPSLKNTTTDQNPSPAPSPTPGPTPTPTPTPTPLPPPPPPVSTGQYKNGSYTGSVADAFYGLLQVKAVISGGKISDVVFLQYPNDQRTSIEVNSQAMPYLKQEAIQAQSANVDIVSGATQSSLAFQKSLAVALSQAK